MEETELRLELMLATCMDASGLPLPAHCSDSIYVGLLQQDLVLVSWSLRRVALVELKQFAAAHMYL